MKVYTNTVDAIVAKDKKDLLKIFEEQYGSDEEFELYKGDYSNSNVKQLYLTMYQALDTKCSLTKACQKELSSPRRLSTNHESSFYLLIQC